MDLIELAPKIGSRTLIVGKTGSGKTEYLKQIMPILSEQTVIILDPKGTFPSDGVLIRTASELNGLTDKRIVWRPDIDTDIVGELDQILRACYWRQNVCICIDDVYGCQVNGVFPKSLQPIYTLGRERQITVVANVQRPTWIPLYMVSEADNHVCFQLKHEDDRKRMAGMMGPNVLKELPRYHFWLQSDDHDVEPKKPQTFTLD